VPLWIWLLVVGIVTALGVVAWLSTRSDRWRPPSGMTHLVSCTYGGRVEGWCGHVVAPLDPLRAHGRTIRLHVAVLPATRRPAAGALFYLEGGPGGAATSSAIRVNALFAQVGRNRDLVMVDQRGTGGSNPLACPRRYVPGTDAEAVADYVRSCLTGIDTDPRLYTTSVAADDLETVRRRLGYGRIDVYGGSYGATLAQAYARRYPGSVRSVVLDSGSLPDVRIYDVAARNAEHALDALLARCAAVPTCKRAYPNSKRQLRDLLARPPRRVSLPSGRVVLRPNDIAWTVDWLSETPANAALIPFAVDAAAHGDYTTLAATHVAQLGGSNLEPLARLVPFWVIICTEPWAAFDPVESARSYLTSAALERARVFRRVCRVVPKGRVATEAGEELRVPVLLLAGSADPLDPPKNLRGWRRLYPHGRLVVVRGGGHGTLEYSCIQALVAQFVDAGGARELSAACARHVSLPAFVTG
jgi:pimeloyl-ACP methyl ester carboxylesterase